MLFEGIRFGRLRFGQVEEGLGAFGRARVAPGGECLARGGRAGRRKRFGRPFVQELSPFGAAVGAEFDHPVGRGDDVEVVFDRDDRVPVSHEAVEKGHQVPHVLKVQTARGFVKEKHLLDRLRSAGARLLRGDFVLNEFGELESLPFARRERRDGLSEFEVFEAEFDERREGAADARILAEEVDRFAHGGVQNVVDRVAAIADRDADGEDAGREALSCANRAGDLHVGEKLHFDDFDTRARARGAAAASRVEGEVAGRQTCRLRFGRGRKEFADFVVGADEAHGGASKIALNRRLVDQMNFRGKVSLQGPEMSGLAVVLRERAPHGPIEDVVDEG